MKNINFICLTLTTSLLFLNGCSESPLNGIERYCKNLSDITDKDTRKQQYDACQNACGDAKIYKMKEGDEKNHFSQLCTDAKRVGDGHFQKSPERNWLGVMPKQK